MSYQFVRGSSVASMLAQAGRCQTDESYCEKISYRGEQARCAAIPECELLLGPAGFDTRGAREVCDARGRPARLALAGKRS